MKQYVKTKKKINIKQWLKRKKYMEFNEQKND